MNQSRIDSLMEAVTNTTVGFVISLITWAIVAWALSIPMTWGKNFEITGIFTVVSVARSYLLRRAFDGRTVWVAIKDRWQSFRDPIVTVEAMDFTWKLPRSVVAEDIASGFATVVRPNRFRPLTKDVLNTNRIDLEIQR